MDIKREPKKHSMINKWTLALLAGGCLSLWSWYLLSSKPSLYVVANQLLYGKVQQGDLVINVNGFGELRSANQKLLTALTSGTVEEILLKPGALVTENSILMRLSNPELLQVLANAEQDLITQEANLRQLKLSQHSDRPNGKSRLVEIKRQYRLAELKREAEQSLVAKGIVSSLDFKRTEEEAKQYKAQLAIQQEIREQQGYMQKEAVSIQQSRIQQAKNSLNNQHRLVDALTVKAKFNGILQSSPVSLGQSINQGEQLALLGSIDQLEAYIQVAQSEVDKVELNQTVQVNIRRD